MSSSPGTVGIVSRKNRGELVLNLVWNSKFPIGDRRTHRSPAKRRRDMTAPESVGALMGDFGSRADKGLEGLPDRLPFR